MPAAATRELAFCPDCYAALPGGSRCGCVERGAPAVDEMISAYRVAVDAPRSRVLVDRSKRLVPAVVAAGVVAVVAVLAAIIS